jgi:hypothetical protein
MPPADFAGLLALASYIDGGQIDQRNQSVLRLGTENHGWLWNLSHPAR